MFTSQSPLEWVTQTWEPKPVSHGKSTESQRHKGKTQITVFPLHLILLLQSTGRGMDLQKLFFLSRTDLRLPIHLFKQALDMLLILPTR